MSTLPALPNISTALDSLKKLELDIKNAPSFKALDSISAAASAIQRTFRPVKEVADRAGEVWTHAEIKLAEELEKLPKAKGGEQFHQHPTGSDLEPVPTLSEMGVDKKRAWRAKQLRAIPVKQRAKYVRDLKEEGRGVTPDAILRKHREHNRDQRRTAYALRTVSGGTVKDLFALAESGQKFAVIYADPPWRFETFSEKGKGRSPDYKTMSVEALAALPVEALAAEDCALLLWATMPILPAALDLIRRWNFIYKTVAFVWIKQNADESLFTGQGYWTRSNAELVLLATRGSPMRLVKDVHQVVMAPVGEHSAKPIEVRRRIERLLPGPYLEMFARSEAEKWTSWGNEI
jgi:N6-adenosine-specific RNA methylase IME4